MAVHEGRTGRQPTIRLVEWQKWATVSDIIRMYVYTLHLRHEDPILAILCIELRNYYYHSCW